MKILSVIIPAYNEEAYIGDVIQKVIDVPIDLLGYEKEIIVVDDGSSDKTYEISKSFHHVTTLTQANQGKGRAVQNGFQKCTGDYVLVQDADLEYDINDYIPMLKSLNESPTASIYGSRILGQIKFSGNRTLFIGKHPRQGMLPWLAGMLLTFWTFLLYGKWITDTLTAYKIYPAHILRDFTIKTHGFETDHEITGKLIRAGVEIIEVPISYQPRSVKEGKKIAFKDAVKAFVTLFRFRFFE